MGTSSLKNRATSTFFAYSDRKEYLVTPDVVEYDKKNMIKPVYDLILGCNTMKEPGIVLDFRTKEITIDEVILPMRDSNSLTISTMDKAWAVNNSMAHEPSSTQDATQRVVHILDAKYEKADLQSIVIINCTHLSLQDQNLLLELLTEFDEHFDGTLGDFSKTKIS